MKKRVLVVLALLGTMLPVGTLFQPASAGITLFAGSPVTFDLGSYTLRVTPNSSSVSNQTGSTFTFGTNAEFLLTAVPEPVSGLLMLAGVGMLASRRPRRD